MPWLVQAVDNLMPGFDKEIARLAQRLLITPRRIDYHTGVLATKVTPGTSRTLQACIPQHPGVCGIQVGCVNQHACLPHKHLPSQCARYSQSCCSVARFPRAAYASV